MATFKSRITSFSDLDVDLLLDEPYKFDLDRNGFPVFSDKNIAFAYGLVNNDSNYTWIDEKTLCKEYELAASGDERAIQRTVYYVNKLNSTHLAAIAVGSSKGDKNNGKKSVQSRLLDELHKASDFPLEIEVETRSQSDEETAENSDANTSSEKPSTLKLTGGTLLTAAYLQKHYSKEDNNLGNYLLEKDNNKRAALVASIARATTNMADELLREDTKDEFNYNRSNFSFATKFCHHGCRNLSKGQLDNFCIYDRVVAKMLPYYADAYIDDHNWLDEWGKQVNETGWTKRRSRYSWIAKAIDACTKTPEIGKDEQVAEGYRHYFDLYSHIINGINEWRRKKEQHGRSDGTPAPKIGFHEVDLLIWYYFKGRRLEEAQEEMKRIATQCDSYSPRQT